MNKIVILVPYFGKWPQWIALFFDSVERNPTIDFHFFTDCDIKVSSSSNVHFHKMSFSDYVKNAEVKIGCPINITHPYKICDLRPFFGLIHEKEIADYEFFGWTDIDLLFGDIRSFYHDGILANYDVLSTHCHRLSGHFALLRNTPAHRQIGYKIYDWKNALMNPEFVGIDEHGITNALQMTLLDKVVEKFNFSKNNPLLNLLRKLKTRKHYFVEQYTTPFTPIPWLDNSLNSNQPSEWYYHKGVVSNNRDTNRVFIYIHFMNFKSSKWRADNTIAPWQDTFKYEVQSTEGVITINSEGIISQ